MADPANPGTLPLGSGAAWGLIRVGGRVNTYSNPGMQPSLPDGLALGVQSAHRWQPTVEGIDTRNHVRVAGMPSAKVGR